MQPQEVGAPSCLQTDTTHCGRRPYVYRNPADIGIPQCMVPNSYTVNVQVECPEELAEVVGAKRPPDSVSNTPHTEAKAAGNVV